jgi:hypothetical protein
LVGPLSSGKYSLSRFLSSILEWEFIYLEHPSLEERFIPQEKMKELIFIFKEIVSSPERGKTLFYLEFSVLSLDFLHALVSFAQSFDFSIFFQPNELEDFYQKRSLNSPLTPELRTSIFEKVRLSLMTTITVFISCEISHDFGQAFDEIPIDDLNQESFNIIS